MSEMKPSPGALRAAQALYRYLSTQPYWANPPMHETDYQQVAEIIDRETAAPDLLAALGKCISCMKACDPPPLGSPSAWFELMDKTEMLIAKTTKESPCDPTPTE